MRLNMITRRRVVLIAAVLAAGPGMPLLQSGPARGRAGIVADVSARTRRRRGGRAALRRRIHPAPAGAEGPDLAPLPGRRWPVATSTTTSATPTSLTMRGVLEAILTHPEGVDAGTLAEIRRYTKLFWINTGPYNHLTARKFVLKCSPAALAAAARAAAEGRGPVPDRRRRDPRRAARAAPPDVLRPRLRADRHQQDPGTGQGHPRGQRQQPVRRRHDGRPRGVRRALPAQLAAGQARRQARRGAVPGRRPVRRPDRPDRPAPARRRPKVAPEPTAQGARRPDHVLPDRRDRRPRGVRHRLGPGQGRRRSIRSTGSSRSTWTRAGSRGRGSRSSPTSTPRRPAASRSSPAEAQWFEDHMPWDAKYRKPDVQGITANAIEVVIETGDCGPVTPIGINLPNDQAVREQLRQQVGLALERHRGQRQVDADRRSAASSAWTPEEAERATKWSVLAQRAPGEHARGDRPRLRASVSETLKGKPQDALKEHYSAPGGRPRRPRRPLLHGRPQARRAGPGRGRRPGRDRPRRVRELRAQRPGAAPPDQARATRSKKTTCATAR